MNERCCAIIAFFAWLPVESIIHDRQREYYESINRSNDDASSAVFIEFMLSAIKEALEEAVSLDAPDINADLRWSAVQRYLNTHPFITNSDVRELLKVSPATANRILAGFCREGKLVKLHMGRTWAYKPIYTSE